MLIHKTMVRNAAHDAGDMRPGECVAHGCCTPDQMRISSTGDMKPREERRYAAIASRSGQTHCISIAKNRRRNATSMTRSSTRLKIHGELRYGYSIRWHGHGGRKPTLTAFVVLLGLPAEPHIAVTRGWKSIQDVIKAANPSSRDSRQPWNVSRTASHPVQPCSRTTRRRRA